MFPLIGAVLGGLGGGGGIGGMISAGVSALSGQGSSASGAGESSGSGGILGALLNPLGPIMDIFKGLGSMFGGGAAAGQAAPAQTQYAPSRDPHTACQGYAPHPNPGSYGPSNDGSSHSDPRMSELESSLHTLRDNFSSIDGSERPGMPSFFFNRDGNIDLHELKNAAQTEWVGEDVRQAARFVLENPDLLNKLDTAGNIGEFDGKFNKANIDAMLDDVRRSKNGSGSHHTTSYNSPDSIDSSYGPSSNDWGSQDNGVNEEWSIKHSVQRGQASNDFATQGEMTGDANVARATTAHTKKHKHPATSHASSGSHHTTKRSTSSQSLEDIIQSALSGSSDKLDKEIRDVASQMGGSKGDDQQLQLKMQQLVQKREQLFSMMSNMSQSFHHMSMSAVNNMKA